MALIERAGRSPRARGSALGGSPWRCGWRTCGGRAPRWGWARRRSVLSTGRWPILLLRARRSPAGRGCIRRRAGRRAVGASAGRSGRRSHRRTPRTGGWGAPAGRWWAYAGRGCIGRGTGRRRARSGQRCAARRTELARRLVGNAAARAGHHFRRPPGSPVKTPLPAGSARAQRAYPLSRTME
jgi:hypothetical protein